MVTCVSFAPTQKRGIISQGQPALCHTEVIKNDLNQTHSCDSLSCKSELLPIKNLKGFALSKKFEAGQERKGLNRVCSVLLSWCLQEKLPGRCVCVQAHVMQGAGLGGKQPLVIQH